MAGVQFEFILTDKTAANVAPSTAQTTWAAPGAPAASANAAGATPPAAAGANPPPLPSPAAANVLPAAAGTTPPTPHAPVAPSPSSVPQTGMTAAQIAQHAAKGFNVAQTALSGGLLAGAAEAATAIPVAGLAIAAALGVVAVTVSKIDEAIDDRVQKLGQFSPAIAASKARQESLDILNNFQRAQKNGGDLAKFNETTGELSRQIDNLTDTALIPILKLITPAINALGTVASGLNNAVETIEESISSLEGSSNPTIKAIVTALRGIVANTDPEKGNMIDKLLLNQEWLDPPAALFDVGQSEDVFGESHFTPMPGVRLP